MREKELTAVQPFDGANVVRRSAILPLAIFEGPWQTCQRGNAMHDPLNADSSATKCGERANFGAIVGAIAGAVVSRRLKGALIGSAVGYVIGKIAGNRECQAGGAAQASSASPSGESNADPYGV